jgi:hypothetical protein
VERTAIDVDSDDLVAARIYAGQRSGPAAEVEDPPPRAADDTSDRLAARSASPDKLAASAAASMPGVEGVQCLQPVDSPV